jgi:hypothetical protein
MLRTLLTTLFLLLFNLAFAQDINQIIAEQMIDTILYSGPKDNRINWAIQNRGSDNTNDEFTSLAEFSQAFEDDLFRTFDIDDVQAKAPYAQYRDFFNLYAFFWPDALSDSEGWNFNIIKGIRDTLFLPWANEETGWASFFSTTKFGGGGGAGVDRDNRVGDAKVFGMGWETFIHEFGHTMPGLLDEYSASGEWSGGQCWETPNTTGQLVWEDVPWRLWIDPSTPLPTPYTGDYLDEYGAFEGALTNFFGCHRPTARNCIMGAGGFGVDYGQDLCGPCVQRTICFLYKYVNVIENPFPASSILTVDGAETLTFSADILHPVPNTQVWQWTLNGEVIATGVESVDITFGGCDQYELKLSVLDTTSMIKYDPKFDEIYPRPYREHIWSIDQLAVNNYDLTADPQVTGADCTGGANGTVDFSISGGQAPYTWWQEGALQPQPLTDLAPGNYEVSVVDAAGCGLTVPFTVDQELLLRPQLCAALVGDNWTVEVEPENYPLGELTVQWSTGAIGPILENVPNGTYTATITTNGGCTVVRSLTLEDAPAPLSVSSTVFASEADMNTGRIYLDIAEGRSPYTIEWKDLPDGDVTAPNPDQTIASGDNFGHFPEMAFDDDLGTKWLHNIPSGAWIGYEIPGGAVVTAYAITSADDVPERDPKDWQLQGSFDGVTWQVLDQVLDHEFEERFERRGFVIDNTSAYNFYRLFVLENYGNSAIQLQELEFLGAAGDEELVGNPMASGLSTRIHLAPGQYAYYVKDQNQTLVSDTLQVKVETAFAAEELQVIQLSPCEVGIQSPLTDHEYVWFADQEGSRILHIGNSFQPSTSNNYYVRASTVNGGSLSSNTKGFAVQVAPAPEVTLQPDTGLAVVNPDPALEYYWYDQDACGSSIHNGTEYVPSSNGTFYVAARSTTEYPDPIDPTTISGMVVRLDAADLNGDGEIDNPAPATSSLLDWTFSNGNFWHNGSWFAYRSNFQNGLGVADFGTIWLQRIENQEGPYQTYIMAYEENPLSFPHRAPFETLSSNFPRHEDSTQLYSELTPSATLNGTTFLNGAQVDPLQTPNPMEFCILGTAMSQPTSFPLFYTDTHWEGKLGELILWDHALTPAEMQGVSEYLRRKWISTAELESVRTAVEWTDANAVVATPLMKTQIFPNPTQGQLQIAGVDGIYSLEVLDMEGRLLLQRSEQRGTLVLSIEHLPPGTYLVRLQTENGKHQIVQKLIKQ